MVLDASLNVNSLKDITSGRLAVNFEDSRGRLQSGSITVSGEKFNVSFASNGAATVKKNFEGFFGGIRTFFMGHTAKAQEIERKMNSIILANGGKDFKIVSNSKAYLANVIRNSQVTGRLEVADYGISRNRKMLENASLIAALNEKYAASTGKTLFFNKIDDYNSISGINPESFSPMNFAGTLEKIRTNSLGQNPNVSMNNFDMEKIAAWKAFLARPENVAKIDIPGKLHRYMNLPQGHHAAKETGWEATFANAANKEDALAQFVLKNLPKSAKDISPEDFKDLCSRVKQFADLSAMEAGPEKDEAMKDFFKRENWLGKKEMDKLQEIREEYADTPDEDRLDYWKSQTETQNTEKYVLFSNIYTNAMFRQTSKMGLEFFKEQKIPILFQYADNTGKSMEGRFKSEVWKEASKNSLDDVRKSGGSPITYSEMRRAAKISQQAEVRDLPIAQSPIIFTPGVKNA